MLHRGRLAKKILHEKGQDSLTRETRQSTRALMTDSGETAPNSVEGSAIVLPRRNKKRRRKIKSPKQLQQEVQCFGPDIRVSSLTEKVLQYMKEVEESEFYHRFLSQMETPEIMENFHKVLGHESTMQMVIYGIGSIESDECPRFQLGLAILMKRKFSWIGSIEVFDPVISPIESRVFEALGCCVLSVNEECKRQALTPTMFFMPHCDEDLYCNLLQANWRVDMLNRIVVFGNTFSVYIESWRRWSLWSEIATNNNQVKSCRAQAPSKSRNKLIDRRRYMSAATRFMKEIEIREGSGNIGSSFSDLGWLFFSPDSESELQLNL